MFLNIIMIFTYSQTVYASYVLSFTFTYTTDIELSKSFDSILWMLVPTFRHNFKYKTILHDMCFLILWMNEQYLNLRMINYEWLI